MSLIPIRVLMMMRVYVAHHKTQRASFIPTQKPSLNYMPVLWNNHFLYRIVSTSLARCHVGLFETASGLGLVTQTNHLTSYQNCNNYELLPDWEICLPSYSLESAAYTFLHRV